MLEIKVEIKKLDSHSVSYFTSDSFSNNNTPFTREGKKQGDLPEKPAQSERVENYLTNSLVQVSVDLDARVKIRALELSGESVRLFTKQNEIKVQQ